MVARLRRWARWVLRTPERWQHASRRKAALELIARTPRPPRCVVLCYGNICRSPYAARLLRVALGAGIEVREGGFYGPDRVSPDGALAAATRRGHVSLTDHRSRLVTPDDVSWATLVVVMDHTHATRLRDGFPAGTILMLGDLDPLPVERRDLPDPYGKPDAEFDAVYGRIERCVAELARALTSPARAQG